MVMVMMMIMMIMMIIIIIIIYVLTQQPDGQLQEQHNQYKIHQ